MLADPPAKSAPDMCTADFDVVTMSPPASIAVLLIKTVLCEPVSKFAHDAEQI
jgi:hypothetical protein